MPASKHRVTKLVAICFLGLATVAAQSPPDGANWLQFSTGLEITFEDRNTTVFLGEHYDYYANRFHSYFTDDSGGSPTIGESAVDLNTTTYYRMDENLPGGCGIYPMNQTSNAARFMEGSSVGTPTPHVKRPADFIMRGTISKQRYLKDERVRGIMCETFQYRDRNVTFAGPGLMGRRVDITMTVSYAKAVAAKQDRVPVQTILDGTHLDDRTAFRHIYTYSAFRPWLDSTFQGFNLTRYAGCRRYTAPFSDWVYRGAASSKTLVPVTPGEPPRMPQLSDSFEVMTEGAHKTENYSTSVFIAYDHTNNRRAQLVLKNGTDVGYRMFEYWDVGIRVKLPPPTSAQIAAGDVPCVVSKLRDGGRSDDGTMHVRSARDLWSWANDDGSSAKTKPGVSQSPQVYQGRFRTRGIAVDRWKSTVSVDRRPYGGRHFGSYDVQWDFSAIGWNFQGNNFASQYPIQVVTSGTIREEQPMRSVKVRAMDETWELFGFEPKVRQADFRSPLRPKSCQNFNVVGRCVLSEGIKTVGGLMYGDLKIERSSHGPEGGLKISGAVKRLGRRGDRRGRWDRRYSLVLRGDAAPLDDIAEMAASPLLATVGSFDVDEGGGASIDIDVDAGKNISLFGSSSVIGRSLWIVGADDRAAAKCTIGIDAVDNNFAHPPRRFLSIEKGEALLYPVSWADNGATADEVSPSGSFSAEQKGVDYVDLTIDADGLTPNGEYTVEIHEYGAIDRLGRVGRVFNPKLWGSEGDEIRETWLDARLEVVADALGRLRFKATKNFTLNGWESIIGRSVVLMPARSSYDSPLAIAGVIGISAYDADASSFDDFFNNIANKVVEVWNKIPSEAQTGIEIVGVFVVFWILGLFLICILIVKKRRQKHQQAVQGTLGTPAAKGSDGQEMLDRTPENE